MKTKQIRLRVRASLAPPPKIRHYDPQRHTCFIMGWKQHLASAYILARIIFTRLSGFYHLNGRNGEISYLREVSVAAEGQSSPEADTRDVNDRNRHSNSRELMGSKVTTEGQADWLNQVVKQYGQSLKIQFIYIII